MRDIIDMTGWVMSEHGVPDSRLTVIERAKDHIRSNGRKRIMWKCKCSCNGEKSLVIISADRIRNGKTKSCGCIAMERITRLNKKENKYDLSNGYGVIWATNTNEKIYFDLSDAERILKYTWFIGSNGYPSTHIDGKIVTMHKFLGYQMPDHHNRNKLDNRSENLVQATHKENMRNSSKRRNNTSGYTGVCFIDKTNKWGTFIEVDGKTVSCGEYTNKNDAIVARLKAEAKYYGEFAPQRHLFAQYEINIDNMKDMELTRPLRSDNTSGCTGVSFDENNNKWCAEICVNKHRIRLGRFLNKDDAIRARLQAEMQYFGEESAPQKYLFEEYLKL